jgi:hypothetical protein
VALSVSVLLYSSCIKEESTPITITETFVSIPDPLFESELIALGIDSDNSINNKLLKVDAEQVTRLDLNHSNNFGEINDLSGIEAFINLTYLSAFGQQIRDIDLSSNTKLDTLYLGNNLLTSIGFEDNTRLILVDLQANYLHTLSGLQFAENLKSLNLSFNAFEEVNIDNSSLELLSMTNNLVRSVNLNYAPKLKDILLTSNKLASIDVSSNALLETLVVSDNQLNQINLAHNSKLEYLYVSSNELTSLDVSKNQDLVDLRADRNPGLTCIQIQSHQEIPSLSLSEYQELNDQCN